MVPSAKCGIVYHTEVQGFANQSRLTTWRVTGIICVRFMAKPDLQSQPVPVYWVLLNTWDVVDHKAGINSIGSIHTTVYIARSFLHGRTSHPKLFLPLPLQFSHVGMDIPPVMIQLKDLGATRRRRVNSTSRSFWSSMIGTMAGAMMPWRCHNATPDLEVSAIKPGNGTSIHWWFSHGKSTVRGDFPLQFVCWLVVWNIFHFPRYWVHNHPNWLSYFSDDLKLPTRYVFPFKKPPKTLKISLRIFQSRSGLKIWMASKRGWGAPFRRMLSTELIELSTSPWFLRCFCLFCAGKETSEYLELFCSFWGSFLSASRSDSPWILPANQVADDGKLEFQSPYK